MALQILSTPNDLLDKIRTAIETELPGAAVEVLPNSPGHVEIRVASDRFADKSLVAQQQMVYKAITELMSGDTPALHAVDRLETRLP